jgi:hypothetical protein
MRFNSFPPCGVTMKPDAGRIEMLRLTRQGGGLGMRAMQSLNYWQQCYSRKRLFSAKAYHGENDLAAAQHFSKAQ